MLTVDFNNTVLLCQFTRNGLYSQYVAAVILFTSLDQLCNRRLFSIDQVVSQQNGKRLFSDDRLGAQAMSRDGLLPRAMSKTGAHGTPATLQIVVGVVVALVAACFDISVLSDMVNIGTLSAFTLVALAIPIMRKKRPDLPRTFKIPGNPWVPLIVAAANLWLMLNLTVLTWIRFLVWLVLGFIVYFAYSYNHARLGTGELDAELERFDKEERLRQLGETKTRHD